MSEQKTPSIAGLQKMTDEGKSLYKAVGETKFTLPNIAEIYNDSEMETLHRDNAIAVLLNKEPKKEWVQNHPFIKKEITTTDGRKSTVPYEYIPVERIEWLLTNIFLKWRFEIKDVKLIANSVVVHGRLHYFDHINKTWDWQDGVGACPLQTEKGAGATDFNAIKSAAVQMAAPAAESYALKDAAEKIGRLFGKDINRNQVIAYDTLEDRYKKAMES